MRLSCLQENLSRGLAVVGRAVPTRTTLPITQNVKLTTDRGRLQLSATNLEIAITTWVGAMIEEEGSITVPARLLGEFVASLPADNMSVNGTTQPWGMDLECGKFNARINGADPEEFPPIPSIEDGIAVKLTAQVLRSAIAQTVFAAATEESRPVLTGVKLEIEGDQLTLAAADGFRLAVHRGKLEEPANESVGVIIPGRTLTELNRFLTDSNEIVDMVVSSSRNQISFNLTNIQLVSQLIQGNFPPFDDLVADATKEVNARSVVVLSEFLAASRSTSIFARDSSGIIRLQMMPGENGEQGKIIISSKAEEIGENTGEVEADVSGEESKIAFNSRYLIEVLSAMGGDKICLETSGPSRAGVFKSPESDQYLHLVMPMFVQW